MKFFFNDGGRSASGFLGETLDCVCRSIAIVTGKPYSEVYSELQERSKQERRSKCRVRRSSPNTGIYTDSKWFRDYMAELGYGWTPCMAIGTGCKVHLRENELPQGSLIVAVSKHYTAVVDGVLNDTTDCSRNGNRCVYGYWKKL